MENMVLLVFVGKGNSIKHNSPGVEKDIWKYLEHIWMQSKYPLSDVTSRPCAPLSTCYGLCVKAGISAGYHGYSVISVILPLDSSLSLPCMGANYRLYIVTHSSTDLNWQERTSTYSYTWNPVEYSVVKNKYVENSWSSTYKETEKRVKYVAYSVEN